MRGVESLEAELELDYVVLCLYIIQLKLNDNQRLLWIRGSGGWSHTTAVDRQHLRMTHSSEAKSY